MPLTEQAIRDLDAGQVLDLIIEEAAELIYVASKAKRFGPLHVHPDRPGAETNIRELAMEEVQLSSLVRIFAARFGINNGEMSNEVARRARAQQERGIGMNTIG